MSVVSVAENLPLLTAGREPVSRPWLAQVMHDTVGRAGARFGLIWIGIVGTMAVVAPFLASSHPYYLQTTDPQLVSKYGHTSSPLLKHLTGVDVSLMVVAIAAVMLLFLPRVRPAHRLILLVAITLAVVPLSHLTGLGQTLQELFSAASHGPGRLRAGFKLFACCGLILLDLFVLYLLLFRAELPGQLRTVCLSILVVLTLMLCVFPVNPPVLTNYAQYRQAQAAGRVQHIVRAPIPFSASDRLRDQFNANHPHPWSPQSGHWLGTEDNGGDILSRMIHACRIAMAIGFLATGIAVIIGVIIGGLMGYFVGWVDLIGMRIVEIFGSVPTIYLLLAFVAFFERNLYMMMIIIGLTTWVGDARFVRAEFLRLRNQDFVHAARAAGLPLSSILFRHMLPNAMAPLLVSASFGIASAILYESTLSFLGLGLVDDPSWGQLLNQAVAESGGFHWWLATFPGIAIFLTVFAYNLIGESVRDALDPRLKGTD